MNKKPLISVVIPAFNEEKYLPRCLSSLRNQEFKDFEIIVVDNNSKDKTAEIAQSFGAKVVKESVQGMIPARERGFREAQCEIIARTDADTILFPDWLRKIYNYFNSYPKMVAQTGAFTFPEVNKTQERFLKLFTNTYLKQMKMVMGHYQLNGPNYALRKSAWEKIEVHEDDKIVHEDIDLSCHLYELGDIKYFPQLKVVYSLRRWKRKFWYTMFDYGIRNIRTVLIHHPNFKRHRKLLKLG